MAKLTEFDPEKAARFIAGEIRVDWGGFFVKADDYDALLSLYRDEVMWTGSYQDAMREDR